MTATVTTDTEVSGWRDGPGYRVSWQPGHAEVKTALFSLHEPGTARLLWVRTYQREGTYHRPPPEDTSATIDDLPDRVLNHVSREGYVPLEWGTET